MKRDTEQNFCSVVKSSKIIETISYNGKYVNADSLRKRIIGASVTLIALISIILIII